MSARIHIFGASGSGTTTLGSHLSERLAGRHLDTDSYYWLDTDPPFTHKREPAERVAMIRRDTRGAIHWVLSGSLCSWGDPLLRDFSLAVFLYLPHELRMARIASREKARYGSRIQPGGDMHAAHVQFMDWARSYDEAKAPTRSLDLHEGWMRRLPCPVLRLDSRSPVEELGTKVLEHALA
ncbi:MAG: AAA family ATPase [Planctomycetota bacterium]